LAAAEATRRRLMAVPDKVVPPKASRYSRKVLVHKCGVCGAVATETHHIVYQKDAGGNEPSNLVPLCESCHLDEHTGKISIQGYRATSRGVKLQVVRGP
jgi:5-methylcytosine-specific restriction endonuclease McrA